tara:strand:- start:78 stop:671 length:594 start_codon:yes stop_codon:yes gene_type:complete
MNFVHKFLINIICFIKGFIKKPDYKIVSRELEYWVAPHGDYVTSDNFWEEQSDAWDEYAETYTVELRECEDVPEPPDMVTKMLFRVKYWYNNKIYKYLTYDRKYVWPPKHEKSMRFNIPLVSAQLLNKNGRSVKNILEKIRRYTGPHGCEKIKIADMMYYDDETLRESFPKIQLKNILGATKTVSTFDGYITDLRIP